MSYKNDDDCCDELLPRPNTDYQSAKKLIEKLCDEQEWLCQKDWEISRQMDERGFEGEFDPRQRTRDRIQEIRLIIDALHKSLPEMTPEDIAYENEQDEIALERANDRAVYRAECGYRE